MGEFITGEPAREQIRAALDAIDAAHDVLRATSSDEVGNQFRVEVAERLETQQRTNRGLMYRVFGEMEDPPDETAMVPGLPDTLWARLRVSPKEIKRRFRHAARIRPRRSLIGPSVPAELPELATAVEQGQIGEDHLRAVCSAIDRLPTTVSVEDRAQVERSLVAHATKYDAAFLTKLAARLDDLYHPDGHYDETDRARRRGLHLGAQRHDGMSYLTGWVDPETRSYVEVVTAAVRPGRHLPEGGIEVADHDDRTPAQRCHDGIKLGLKSGIASGQMGQHRGHPVTVIATTTLRDLNQAAHAVADPNAAMPPPAHTGGGSTLPLRDLLRMAADAIHYLAVFDDHTGRPLYLGRQKRIATFDQRIICYARDRGCTHPNCLEPGYHSEVHHAIPWAQGGPTDADSLFFAHGAHHDLIDKGYRTTEITETGRLAWTDGTKPPDINHAHHPDEILHSDTDPPQDEE
jgi:hypothetical protein